MIPLRAVGGRERDGRRFPKEDRRAGCRQYRRAFSAGLEGCFGYCAAQIWSCSPLVRSGRRAGHRSFEVLAVWQKAAEHIRNKKVLMGAEHHGMSPLETSANTQQVFAEITSRVASSGMSYEGVDEQGHLVFRQAPGSRLLSQDAAVRLGQWLYDRLMESEIDDVKRFVERAPGFAIYPPR
jgi:hypothetical protein